VRLVALTCPSSASSERIFSVLKIVLSDEAYRKLSDAVVTAMLLRINDM
jgi:hypothetical protein